MKKPQSTGKLIDFAEYLKHSKIFVETGTCFGRTVATALAAGYEKVISVEAHKDWYAKSVETFKNEPRAILYGGKSTDRLPEMLANFTGPAVFWLDAHPSGPQTAGHDDLMEKGEASEFNQDTILANELEIILTTGAPHVIIIDDQNGYGDSVKKIIKKIETIRPGGYCFTFADEQMGPSFYKDKILICLPQF